MKILLPFILAIAMAFPLHARAEDAGRSPAPHKIAIFRKIRADTVGDFIQPRSTAVTGTDAGPALPAPSPSIPNLIKDCVPGSMIDVKSDLLDSGDPTSDDFAWYNPEDNILIVRASPEELWHVEWMLFGSSGPDLRAPCLVLDCSVSIGTDADGESPEAALLRWSIFNFSGMPTPASATSTGKGTGYSMNIESAYYSGDNLCDMKIDLKVSSAGAKYTATTTMKMTRGKMETLKLGTTKDGKDVYFHMIADFQRNFPSLLVNPGDNPKEAALVKRIEESLAKAKPAAPQPDQARAADVHKVALFYCPNPSALSTMPSFDSKAKPNSCPSIKNVIADCLPGKLYDVRAHFTFIPDVTEPGGGDFAWFNPESNLIIVRASVPNLALVRDDLANKQPEKQPILLMDYAISVGADEDGSHPDADRLHWRKSVPNGATTKTSAAAPKNETACNMEFEAFLVTENPVAYDFIMDLKASTSGIDFHALSTMQLVPGKTETLILGTTPEGKDVYFHVTLVSVTPQKQSEIKDNSGDTALLERVEKSLAKTK